LGVAEDIANGERVRHAKEAEVGGNDCTDGKNVCCMVVATANGIREAINEHECAARGWGSLHKRAPRHRANGDRVEEWYACAVGVEKVKQAG
jgi:hypothetical protein